MILPELLNRIKEKILVYITEDYTQIGGIVGTLEFYDEPELSKDEKLFKQYLLLALKELLDDDKIRVGTLNDKVDEPFLNYWNTSSENIVNKISDEWDIYFNNPNWDYAKNPTFDLTEAYAKEIGKYKNDEEKFVKETGSGPLNSH
jgi:hypothetical protein